MPHPLEDKLGAIRRRARWLVLLDALARLVGVLVAVIALVCLADYLIHFQDPGIRAMCSLAVVAVGATVLYRRVWTAMNARFSDVELALRVERRFPDLKDRLASTIQFLQQREDDPEAGSAALRREIVAQTAADIDKLDLNDVIEVRRVGRTTLAAGLVCLLALGLALCNRQAAGTALARLVHPLGYTAWPKANQLVFNDPPQRLASGERFEVELTDAAGADLPADVRIHYRFQADGGNSNERVESMTNAAGGAKIAGMDNVTRPFSYRAEGGDDDSMPWIDLEVVEPPAIEALALTLHYPAYTGWPPATSDPHIRALVGTRVAFAGKSNKPLRSAMLRVDPDIAIPAKVSADGYDFSISVDAPAPLVIEKSGAYLFDLEDQEAFHGGQSTRYEIRAIEDRPPTIAIEAPTSELFLTADAIVPVRLLAKDDLAIARVGWHWNRSDQAQQSADTTLYEGPKQVAPPAKGETADSRQGESRVVDYRWNLAPLKLKPGTRLSVVATADDYLPQHTSSPPHRLTIITPDELQDRLAERQGAILGELNRVAKLERDARAQISGLEIQLDQVNQLGKQDIDHLQQAELLQRQVQHSLTHPNESVPARIRELLADLKNNKLDSSEIERRMENLLDEIGQLGKESLPAIARELTSSLKTSQAALQEDASAPTKSQAAREAGESLAAAGKQQDTVIKSLEQMIGELSEWDNYRRFHRELSQLRRDQEQLTGETSAAGAKTLTQETKDLKPQQLADLKKLAQRQLDLARHFDRVQQRMGDMLDQLRENEPLAADTVSDALHEARKQALGGKMREAGRNVEQNQVGQAAEHQGQVMKDLDELLNILSNRRESELGRLVKKLREAEDQLNQLRNQQQGLRKRMSQAAKNPNEEEKRQELARLAKEQKQLQNEVERFSRLLKRLQADQASRTAARGGAKMGQAGQQEEQGDAAGAAQQAAEAQKDLDDAQQELAQQRRKAERDLAAEQMARMEDTLKSMKQQQEKLLIETRYYEDRGRKQGRLSRAEAISVGDLARQQTALRGDTEALAKKLSAAVVFELGLSGAARDMAQAADLLEKRDTSGPAQQAEEHALARLNQLLESLKPGEKADKGKEGEGGGAGGEGQGGGGGSGGGITGLAELKLLKLMQIEINDRTRSLEEAFRGKTPTPAQQRDYLRLGEEQARLADLLLEMSQASQDDDAGSDAAPETRPRGDDTPDFRPLLEELP
jgi:hypothetical protein